MKIAIAQLNPVIGDILGNAKLILDAAQKAQNLDAKLIITPELSLIDYPPRDLLIYPSLIERIRKIIQIFAIRNSSFSRNCNLQFSSL
ncbi:MAG: hypothetical protein MGF17_03335 [Trichodesmium sp. MAG_R04]|nr:hypothetical protein [Trichodesmium sp. MAG_R04]